MSRSKPQWGWTPPSLDETRAVDDLYPDDVMSKILDCIPMPWRTSKRDDVAPILLDVGRKFYAFSKYRAPTRGEKIAAIDVLHQQVIDTLVTLSRLDHHTADSLRRCAEVDSAWSGQDTNFGPSGNLRFQDVTVAVHALDRWCLAAKAEAQAEVQQTGRPQHEAERYALTRLRDLWKDLKGVEPKKGELLRVGEALLRPVMERYGIASELEHSVQQVLYRE